MEVFRINGGHLFGIRSGRYSPALHQASKKTPGMHWVDKHMAWCGYPDAVRECVNKLRKAGITVEGGRPKPDCLHESVSATRKQLKDCRDYQKDGALYLASVGKTGALLADEPGLGKTLQAIRAIGVTNLDTVVVCPSFARGVWTREVEKWFPEANVFELYGTKAKPFKRSVRLVDTGDDNLHPMTETQQSIYLIHYDIIYAWVDALLEAKVGGIVFDEIHFLQGEKSRRSIACKALARKVEWRAGLSATPMRNRPRDLWNPLDTLCPGRFGATPFQFYLAHANAHQITIETHEGPKTVWDMNGASRLKELHRRLGFFMLRRTKSDVKMELPPRVRQIVELQVEKDFRVLPPRTLKNKKWMREALAIAADGKIGQVAEMVKNHVEGGSRVIVFSYRKSVAYLIAAMLKKHKIDAATITGDVPLKKRIAAIDEQHNVLTATLDSCSASVDLSYADVCCVAELDYDPSKLVQGEHRVYRFGQKRNVLIQYMIALDTCDVVIRDKLLAKLESFEKAIGEGDDDLDEDFKKTQVSTAKQLRSLAERIHQQGAGR